MPELVLQLTRAGFLALLWLFVLAALRVVRSDLYAAAGLRALVLGRRPRPRRTGRGRTARQLVVTAGRAGGHPDHAGRRPILIGRADDSTLVLDDDYASTRHARHRDAGRRVVRRGPRVDQRHLPRPGEGHRTHYEFRSGSPVRIGKTVIELRS